MYTFESSYNKFVSDKFFRNFQDPHATYRCLNLRHATSLASGQRSFFWSSGRCSFSWFSGQCSFSWSNGQISFSWSSGQCTSSWSSGQCTFSRFSGQCSFDTIRRHHCQENAPKSKDNTPKLSLKEVLGNISIFQRASLLLIGDSVIRHVNPKQFTTHSESLYKVCVPGVTTRDLCAWVHSLPIMCSVKAVTLHVGINDYPAGQISQNNWYELIVLLKKSLSKRITVFQLNHPS